MRRVSPSMCQTDRLRNVMYYFRRTSFRSMFITHCRSLVVSMSRSVLGCSCRCSTFDGWCLVVVSLPRRPHPADQCSLGLCANMYSYVKPAKVNAYQTVYGSKLWFFSTNLFLPVISVLYFDIWFLVSFNELSAFQNYCICFQKQIVL